MNRHWEEKIQKYTQVRRVWRRDLGEAFQRTTLFDLESINAKCFKKSRGEIAVEAGSVEVAMWLRTLTLEFLKKKLTNDRNLGFGVITSIQVEGSSNYEERRDDSKLPTARLLYFIHLACMALTGNQYPPLWHFRNSIIPHDFSTLFAASHERWRSQLVFHGRQFRRRLPHLLASRRA